MSLQLAGGRGNITIRAEVNITDWSRDLYRGLGFVIPNCIQYISEDVIIRYRELGF